MVGPGKRSTPVFFTGAVAGILGIVAMLAYTMLDGLDVFEIVLFVLWLFTIATTIGYAIRSRAKQHRNTASNNQ